MESASRAVVLRPSSIAFDYATDEPGEAAVFHSDACRDALEITVGSTGKPEPGGWGAQVALELFPGLRRWRVRWIKPAEQ